MAVVTLKEYDHVEIETDQGTYSGIVMPSQQEHVVLKLDNGYNIGLVKKRIKNVRSAPAVKSSSPKQKSVNIQNDSLPAIHLLHTGGTIASKVDYRTGAVVSRTEPEEILQSVPEILKLAHIKAKTVFQMWSEDLTPKHWTILADHVDQEIKKGAKGVIVAMGTDTLEYMVSALSFALQNLPIPVLVVGSQRSSDRPSSDAAMNLLCAVQFMTHTDWKGVAVCMHENTTDDSCLIIEGHHVRKLHTSRRDTFRPINKQPIARVAKTGEITYLQKKIQDADKKNAFEKKSGFSDKVGLVKVYPGFRKEELGYYAEHCKGLVIEGYAFGQMPINKWDEHTGHQPGLLKMVKNIAKNMPVVIVSQRPYGLTHMNVYSTSRDLLDVGVIEGKMLSHVAYVKLAWAIANYSKPEDVFQVLATNIAGEILERIEEDTFLI